MVMLLTLFLHLSALFFPGSQSSTRFYSGMKKGKKIFCISPIEPLVRLCALPIDIDEPIRIEFGQCAGLVELC